MELQPRESKILMVGQQNQRERERPGANEEDREGIH